MLAPTILFSLLPGMQGPPLSSLDVHELVARVPSWREAREADHQDLARLFAPLAELRERVAHGARLEFEDWRMLLLQSGLLRWRDRWPKDLPFAVGLHVPQFHMSWGLELVPRIPGWRAAQCRAPGTCGNGAQESFEAEDYQVLGMLPEAEMDVVFDLGEFQWTSPEHCVRTRLGEIRLHVRAVPGVEDCISRLDDPSLTTEIGRRVGAEVRVERVECEAFGPTFTVSLGGILPTHGLGIGLSATLKKQGVALESTCGLSRCPGYDVLWDSSDLPHQHHAQPLDNRECTLVLRGDPARALRDWDATQYWAGEIEVPLSDLIQR